MLKNWIPILILEYFFRRNEENIPLLYYQPEPVSPRS